MENINPVILQQFLQNDSDGANQPFTLFPQELIDMFAMGIIVLIVIAALFLIVYTVGIVRKWKVQSAILDMQKDVKELKQSMTSEKPLDPIGKDTAKIA